MKHFCIFFIASIALIGSKQTVSDVVPVKTDMEFAVTQLKSAIANTPTDSKNYGPRTIKDGKIQYINYILDWTVGFFSGSLWYIYDYTKDEYWKTQAERFTDAIEDAKFNTSHHDVGFVIQNSFGNGYRLIGNEHYKNVMITAAEKILASLSSQTYLAQPGENGFFLLKHCVGSIDRKSVV